MTELLFALVSGVLTGIVMGIGDYITLRIWPHFAIMPWREYFTLKNFIIRFLISMLEFTSLFILFFIWVYNYHWDDNTLPAISTMIIPIFILGVVAGSIATYTESLLKRIFPITERVVKS